MLIYSDPHLGLQRKAHFTRESNKRRNDHVRQTLEEILSEDISLTKICAGDFFDKVNNPEDVLLESLSIAERTTYILAGNHDVPNRTSQASTLEVLREIYPDKVLMPFATQYREVSGAEVNMTFIPHQLTQTEFVNKLDHEISLEKSKTFRRNLLFLHCNYDMQFEMTEDTLNLTRDKASELLTRFDHIFIGHEHSPKDDFDNRLHVIGSPYPSSFSEDTDHRVLIYDSDSNEVGEIITFERGGFWSGNASEAPDGFLFYSLKDDDGKAAKRAVELLKTAYAVRVEPRQTQETEKPDIKKFRTLTEVIRKSIPDDLKSIFEEMLND